MDSLVNAAQKHTTAMLMRIAGCGTLRISTCAQKYPWFPGSICIRACDNPVCPPLRPLRHFLLALAVVAVWSINFVAIKFAFGAWPPLLMTVFRFGFGLLPGLFFVTRPAVRLSNLALYGS